MAEGGEVAWALAPSEARESKILPAKVAVARIALMHEHLMIVGDAPFTAEPDKSGTVVSTNPPAGAEVPVRTAVALTVYGWDPKAGPHGNKPGNLVTVPSVVGLKSSQAMTVLSHVLLQGKPASDTQITNYSTKDGTVASQSPAAGAQVDAQTMVVVTLYFAAEKAGKQ